MSGAKVMGLESQIRKLEQNLLIWKEGYTDVKFRIFPRRVDLAKVVKLLEWMF